MRKEIKIKEEVRELLQSKDDVSVLSFVNNNRKKLLNFSSIMASGLSNEINALKRCGISYSSYMRINRVYEKALEYCESKNINIEDTEFEDLYLLVIDIARAKNIQIDDNNAEIKKLLGDEYTEDKDGIKKLVRKGASVSEILKYQQYLNPSSFEYLRQNNNININNENNQEKNNGTTFSFNVISATDAFKLSEASQKSIIDETALLCEDIERQIANGDLNNNED